MNFNKHSELEGLHAILGPSSYHWLNADEEKIRQRYQNSFATTIGTTTHELAKKLIDKQMKLNKSDRHLFLFYLLDAGIPRELINTEFIFPNLSHYVNDAIGFRMTPEQILYYSENCFGTADSISFRNNLLRIHDLKTGTTPASMKQLEIYAALFCLEYKIRPGDIGMELRLYQSRFDDDGSILDEVVVHTPAADDILPIMDKIVVSDKWISKVKEEGN